MPGSVTTGPRLSLDPATTPGAASARPASARRSSARPSLDAAAAALARGATEAVRAHCRAGYAALGATRDAATAAGELMHLEARAAFADGDAAGALDALTAALAVAEAVGDAGARAHALNNLGNVHCRCGQLDEAERLYESARHQAVQIGDRPTARSATLNLGVIANVRGDLRRARSYYRRALADARRDRAVADELRALNNLGLLYADLAQWDRAERAYRDALAITEHVGDDQALAQLHANLAEVWLGLGDVTRAHAACTAGVAASRRTPDGAHRGELHKMAGVVARESGALEEADAELAAAERIARERQDLLLLAETVREQADLYRRQGRNRDTLSALNRSRALFDQLRARRDLADVGHRMSRLEGEFVEVARRWGESIEAADRYTQGHCQRVADLACSIAAHAGPAHGFDPQTMFWYRIGALLHDVGKLEIPADVLNKPGKLTSEEFALMRGHAEAGVALLGDMEFPWDIRPIVLSHHERWDGRGYPHAIAGDAIPLSARILAVADVYDALTSVRSYKRAMSHEDACGIILKDAGTAFDPQVVAWFEAVAPAWQATLAAAADGADAAATPDVRAQRRAASVDEVTGLPGRQAFFDEAARVLAARAADGRPTSLLLITLVPAPGGTGVVSDAALAAVGEAVSRNTRGGDFVGRYSERELVVLMPDTTAEEGAGSLTRLRDVVGTALRRSAAEVPAATAALGVSTAPDGGTTGSALLAAADTALRRGRGGPAAAGRPTRDPALQSAA